MKAPFPYFGGKRRVAHEVWSAFGDCDSYIEPFAGSLAVLLDRPDWHDPKAETVNDVDCYLANFWRAISAEPEAVAEQCDWPVNEADLFARHMWLVNSGKERIAKIEADPDFYDVKVAGWWVWGINAWIGSGWCAGNGPWRVVNGEAALTPNSGGQWRQLPHLGDAGQGINRQLPHLGNAGQGINRKLPHLGDREPGKELPQCWTGNLSLLQYFNDLAARLRRVRVCCGDWSRVVTNGAMAYGDTVGVFLDPPYLGDVRYRDLYRVDNHDIANEVREWCIANASSRVKVILAGYEDEHVAKMPGDWRVLEYSASKAYGTTAAVGGGKGNDANRHNERLWFSPGCLSEMELFR